ncbi:hypothetical protein [Cupriavidus alkaliphilus]|uniref:DUF551 domain-containing protein n=1 Tax=Cupriavidus alkaliphilus TaxID=942866 RepID=A0A7W4YTA6_9BURK|nr:hypothetical protein [Cupriavidus alkaliphilus]MBB3010695.1 hypothetical protein [Cupriavidus alkaliphilus]
MTTPATTPADGLDATLPFEQALAELIGKIDSSLDSGDILSDARRASAALDSIMRGGDLVANAYDYFRDSEQWYLHSIDFRIGWNACLDAIESARRATPSPGKAPERTKLDDDLLATIREAAKTRAEGAITQDGRAVFINYGDSEQQMLDAAEMDCPHCGGSGHKDDTSPGKAEAERWQPIETAPNNIPVLVAVEFDGPNDWRIKVGALQQGHWRIFGGSWTPSHWMPLPAAPAAIQQESNHD